MTTPTEPTAHPDYLARIRTRADHIQQLVNTVITERKALRADLTAAKATGSYRQKELVTAADGGLSRALVLEHLGDISGKVRRALKRHDLTADVTIRQDGTVTFGGVWPTSSHAETYSPPSRYANSSEDDEDDPDYQNAQGADHLNFLNSIGSLITELHDVGLNVFHEGGDPATVLARHGTITVTRRDA